MGARVQRRGGGAPGGRKPRAARPAVRRARAADAAAIFVLVRELARYERLTRWLTGGPRALARHLAGRAQPPVEGLVAEANGKVVGYALCFMGFSSFRTGPILWLEDLYVTPACRRLGLGEAMLRTLARLAIARRCDRLEWWVLAWNEPALRFYRSIGARGGGEERVWRLRGAALRAFARVRTRRAPPRSRPRPDSRAARRRSR